MMRTPELAKFHKDRDQLPRYPPANTPGIRRIMFAIEDIDTIVARIRAREAELIG
jgi:hypothetical protein